MKEVIRKCLQDESTLLRSTRCSKLEDKIVLLESSVNHVEQYGWRNSIAITGIPQIIADDELEDTATSIMEDVDGVIQNGDIEACQNWEIWQKTSSKKMKHMQRRWGKP